MSVSHLFTSHDGNLYDTRASDWSTSKPLRSPFSRHFRRIENAAQLKATLRAGSFSDLGGYPLYLICADGEVLSFEAARDNLRECLGAYATGARDWRVVACEINYEDSSLYCAHTGERIPPTYAEDESDDESDESEDA